MENTYTISKHAKERYTERILEKSTANEIQTFIAKNEEKIVTDINKMIIYGDLIYSGKQTQKDGRSYTVEVFLNGLWIVLADAKKKNVITLYKVDLGVDDDFNNEYVARMLEKLKGAEKRKDEILEEIERENQNYRDMIDQNLVMINEYRGYIKNLEDLNSSYKTIMENNCVKGKIANDKVVDVVNKLIGKKEF